MPSPSWRSTKRSRLLSTAADNPSAIAYFASQRQPIAISAVSSATTGFGSISLSRITVPSSGSCSSAWNSTHLGLLFQEPRRTTAVKTEAQLVAVGRSFFCNGERGKDGEHFVTLSRLGKPLSASSGGTSEEMNGARTEQLLQALSESNSPSLYISKSLYYE